MATKSELENTGIESVRLVEASHAWDGTPLPDYPRSSPVISIYRYTFPPHTVTNRHFHKVINCGVVIRGTLTIVSDSGAEHTFHAGEAIIEPVGEIHPGENRGDEDTVVIMFYDGDASTPLSTPAK